MNIDELMKFVGFLHDFANIKRTVKIRGRDDFENDAEHSYQVAIASWYITERLGIEINRQLILEYALVHDLVEVYAGDTDVWKSSAAFVASKEAREADAKEKIKINFPDFVSMHERIEGYEHLKDLESKVVYVVDKILPNININLAEGKYYKDTNITYEAWKKWLLGKVERSGLQDQKILTIINELITYEGNNRFSEAKNSRA